MNSLGRSQEAYDRYSGATDVALIVLSLLWLPVLLVPIVVRLSPDLAGTFDAIDYLVWAVFVVDYGVKFYLAPSRRRYVVSHPVELATVVLPFLRPLRALRLLRLLNLLRAGVVLANALFRVRRIITHRGLHFVLLTTTGIVVVCAALEFAFEQDAPKTNIQNFGDALWWAVVTVTTVGYGDRFPVSAAGRGIAVVLMLVGIGLIGVLTASVASYLVEQKADSDAAEIHDRLDRIEDMLARVLDAGPEQQPVDMPGGRRRISDAPSPPSADP